MAKPKIYIDGQEGTTGLRIFERFAGRDDIEILTIDPALRKDLDERKKLINASDITFLCLPDAAAKEAVSLIDNDNVRVIDASTAHRVNPDWAYGFAELSPAHREAIATGKRIANPGCHATGFVSIVHPLVASGLLPADTALTCFSLTGYSGGGKKMIAQYGDEGRDPALDSPRIYGLTHSHKHLPEMQKVCGLASAPLFTPIVADYYAGMLVSVPLMAGQLKGVSNLAHLHECYADAYASQKMIKVMPLSAQADVGGFLSSNGCAGWDGLEIYVTGNDERMMVCARFDNLGKGASGAAVQSMNIMLGCDEATGLTL
ncbi:MAG: N-acetyl-gamma-glutamyl-phosphate reductase [Clostridia bacterium]|nr:N-acetyl-gamma-glutamyl-phosphate reductase [Clostridia bacterium]